MKTNPNDAAFARPCGQNPDNFNRGSCGLTKLEYMTTQIMQGLAARSIHADNSLAESAVKLAIALIDELNKERNDGE